MKLLQKRPNLTTGPATFFGKGNTTLSARSVSSKLKTPLDFWSRRVLSRTQRAKASHSDPFRVQDERVDFDQWNEAQRYEIHFATVKKPPFFEPLEEERPWANPPEQASRWKGSSPGPGRSFLGSLRKIKIQTGQAQSAQLTSSEMNSGPLKPSPHDILSRMTRVKPLRGRRLKRMTAGMTGAKLPAPTKSKLDLGRSRAEEQTLSSAKRSPESSPKLRKRLGPSSLPKTIPLESFSSHLKALKFSSKQTLPSLKGTPEGSPKGGNEDLGLEVRAQAGASPSLLPSVSMNLNEASGASFAMERVEAPSFEPFRAELDRRSVQTDENFLFPHDDLKSSLLLRPFKMYPKERNFIVKNDNFSIKIASSAQIQQAGTREKKEIRDGRPVLVRYGEVENDETVSYKDFTHPVRGGLYCDRTFGPVMSWVCTNPRCSSNLPKNIPQRGRKTEDFLGAPDGRGKYREMKCNKCGNGIYPSALRRYRMGYIHLYQPLVHVSYIHSRQNLFAHLLGWKNKQIHALIYNNINLINFGHTELFSACFAPLFAFCEDTLGEALEWLRGDYFSSSDQATVVLRLLQPTETRRAHKISKVQAKPQGRTQRKLLRRMPGIEMALNERFKKGQTPWLKKWPPEPHPDFLRKSWQNSQNFPKNIENLWSSEIKTVDTVLLEDQKFFTDLLMNWKKILTVPKQRDLNHLENFQVEIFEQNYSSPPGLKYALSCLPGMTRSVASFTPRYALRQKKSEKKRPSCRPKSLFEEFHGSGSARTMVNLSSGLDFPQLELFYDHTFGTLESFMKNTKMMYSSKFTKNSFFLIQDFLTKFQAQFLGQKNNRNSSRVGKGKAVALALGRDEEGLDSAPGPKVTNFTNSLARESKATDGNLHLFPQKVNLWNPMKLTSSRKYLNFACFRKDAVKNSILTASRFEICPLKPKVTGQLWADLHQSKTLGSAFVRTSQTGPQDRRSAEAQTRNGPAGALPSDHLMARDHSSVPALGKARWYGRGWGEPIPRQIAGFFDQKQKPPEGTDEAAIERLKGLKYVYMQQNLFMVRNLDPAKMSVETNKAKLQFKFAMSFDWGGSCQILASPICTFQPISYDYDRTGGRPGHDRTKSQSSFDFVGAGSFAPVSRAQGQSLRAGPVMPSQSEVQARSSAAKRSLGPLKTREIRKISKVTMSNLYENELYKFNKLKKRSKSLYKLAPWLSRLFVKYPLNLKQAYENITIKSLKTEWKGFLQKNLPRPPRVQEEYLQEKEQQSAIEKWQFLLQRISNFHNLQEYPFDLLDGQALIPLEKAFEEFSLSRLEKRHALVQQWISKELKFAMLDRQKRQKLAGINWELPVLFKKGIRKTETRLGRWGALVFEGTEDWKDLEMAGPGHDSTEGPEVCKPRARAKPAPEFAGPTGAKRPADRGFAQVSPDPLKPWTRQMEQSSRHGLGFSRLRTNSNLKPNLMPYGPERQGWFAFAGGKPLTYAGVLGSALPKKKNDEDGKKIQQKLADFLVGEYSDELVLVSPLNLDKVHCSLRIHNLFGWLNPTWLPLYPQRVSRGGEYFLRPDSRKVNAGPRPVMIGAKPSGRLGFKKRHRDSFTRQTLSARSVSSKLSMSQVRKRSFKSLAPFHRIAKISQSQQTMSKPYLKLSGIMQELTKPTKSSMTLSGSKVGKNTWQTMGRAEPTDLGFPGASTWQTGPAYGPANPKPSPFSLGADQNEPFDSIPTFHPGFAKNLVIPFDRSNLSKLLVLAQKDLKKELKSPKKRIWQTGAMTLTKDPATAKSKLDMTSTGAWTRPSVQRSPSQSSRKLGSVESTKLGRRASGGQARSARLTGAKLPAPTKSKLHRSRPGPVESANSLNSLANASRLKGLTTQATDFLQPGNSFNSLKTFDRSRLFDRPEFFKEFEELLGPGNAFVDQKIPFEFLSQQNEFHNLMAFFEASPFGVKAQNTLLKRIYSVLFHPIFRIFISRLKKTTTARTFCQTKDGTKLNLDLSEAPDRSSPGPDQGHELSDPFRVQGQAWTDLRSSFPQKGSVSRSWNFSPRGTIREWDPMYSWLPSEQMMQRLIKLLGSARLGLLEEEVVALQDPGSILIEKKKKTKSLHLILDLLLTLKDPQKLLGLPKVKQVVQKKKTPRFLLSGFYGQLQSLLLQKQISQGLYNYHCEEGATILTNGLDWVKEIIDRESQDSLGSSQMGLKSPTPPGGAKPLIKLGSVLNFGGMSPLTKGKEGLVKWSQAPRETPLGQAGSERLTGAKLPAGTSSDHRQSRSSYGPSTRTSLFIHEPDYDLDNLLNLKSPDDFGPWKRWPEFAKFFLYNGGPTLKKYFRTENWQKTAFMLRKRIRRSDPSFVLTKKVSKLFETPKYMGISQEKWKTFLFLKVNRTKRGMLKEKVTKFFRKQRLLHNEEEKLWTKENTSLRRQRQKSIRDEMKFQKAEPKRFVQYEKKKKKAFKSYLSDYRKNEKQQEKFLAQQRKAKERFKAEERKENEKQQKARERAELKAQKEREKAKEKERKARERLLAKSLREKAKLGTGNEAFDPERVQDLQSLIEKSQGEETDLPKPEVRSDFSVMASNALSEAGSGIPSVKEEEGEAFVSSPDESRASTESWTRPSVQQSPGQLSAMAQAKPAPLPTYLSDEELFEEFNSTYEPYQKVLSKLSDEEYRSQLKPTAQELENQRKIDASKGKREKLKPNKVYIDSININSVFDHFPFSPEDIGWSTTLKTKNKPNFSNTLENPLWRKFLLSEMIIKNPKRNQGYGVKKDIVWEDFVTYNNSKIEYDVFKRNRTFSATPRGCLSRMNALIDLDQAIKRYDFTTRKSEQNKANQYYERFADSLKALALPTSLGQENVDPNPIFGVKKRARKITEKKRLVKQYRAVLTLLKNPSCIERGVFDKFPILPPDLRPILQIGDVKAISDITALYTLLIQRNLRHGQMLFESYGESNEFLIDSKTMVQVAADNTLDKCREKNFKTIIKGNPWSNLSSKTEQDQWASATPRSKGPGGLGGPTPPRTLYDRLSGKPGRFRMNLLGKRVDYSGRSVIIVGPTLKVDQCGVPYEMALELFQPFVLRYMLEDPENKVKKYLLYDPWISEKSDIGELLTKFASDGRVTSLSQAKTILRKKKALGRMILRQIVPKFPVLLNRAPTLHRLGIQGFYPVLVYGRALHLHPLVCGSFNADFDGDQMAIHIPLSWKARLDIRLLMFAPVNWISPATGQPTVVPSQDMVLGLFYMTLDKIALKKGRGAFFHTLSDAVQAYQTGFLEIQSQIWIKWNGPFANNQMNDESPEEVYHEPKNEGYHSRRKPFFLQNQMRFWKSKNKQLELLGPSANRSLSPGPFKVLQKKNLFVLRKTFKAATYGKAGELTVRARWWHDVSDSRLFSKAKRVVRDPTFQMKESWYEASRRQKRRSHAGPVKYHRKRGFFYHLFGRFENDEDEPLEIRLHQNGNSRKIYSDFQWSENSKEEERMCYIRTTPGRAIINQLMYPSYENFDDQKLKETVKPISFG